MAKSGTTLGGLIKLARLRNGWTLREMSARGGIPLSTLAKVEGDKLSLSYDKLENFTMKIGLTMAEFLSQGEEPQAADPAPHVIGRRSLTNTGNSVQIKTPNYDYEYLCADLREKRMVPMITRIHTKDIADFGEPVRHKGEEFIFVLEGSIEVHLQFYTPVTLHAGQGVYIDSSQSHAYICKDCDSALVLGVCSSEDPNLANELISLAEEEAKQGVEAA